MFKECIITDQYGQEFKFNFGGYDFNGHPYDIEESGVYIADIDGLGPSEITVNTMKIASGMGGVFMSSTHAIRDLVFTFMINPYHDPAVIRRRLYKAFPSNQKINMRFITDLLDVNIDGYRTEADSTVFTSMGNITMTVTCPDVFFRSTKESAIQFAGVTPMFEFPFENEGDDPQLVMSEIYQEDYRQVYYDGDTDAGLVIYMRANGYIKNPIIHHTSSNNFMKINIELNEGQTIVIDTRRNQKDVKLINKNLSEENILGNLSKDSNWIYIHHGDNEFGYDAEKGRDVLNITLTFNTVYEGI